MRTRRASIILLAASLGACQTPSSDELEEVTGELKAGGALFVVGDTALTAPGDAALKKRLEGLALAVTVRTPKQVTTADTSGKRVVVISSTVASSEVGTMFTGLEIPVVTAESAILDDLRMTGTAMGVDFGVAKTRTKLTLMPGSSDPMTAGLSGTQTVTTAATELSWGKPASGAVKVARLPTDSAHPEDASKIVSFRYDTGAQMVGMKAPARRVALFLTDATASILTSQGKALTDAAIRWAAGLPAKKGLGIDCNAGSQCASGLCTDGVCCNSTCGQLCSSCNLAGHEGTCTTVPSGQDPKNQCTADPAGSCGHDGTCDGAGACRFQGPGTICGPAQCSGNTLTLARSSSSPARVPARRFASSSASASSSSRSACAPSGSAPSPSPTKPRARSPNDSLTR